VNRAITAHRVRLTLDDGSQHGIVPLWEALRMAEDAGLDLVEVAPHNTPPVCRLMDYGKHRYDEARKKKHQNRPASGKELDLRPVISDHDLETKISTIRRFLEEGRPVQVTVVFRRREMRLLEQGHGLLVRVIDGCQQVGTPERQPMPTDRPMAVRLMPTKKPAN
jgi:translation initiation factor IF-3